MIDKDLAAALLAERLGADALLLLTDVAAVRARLGRRPSADRSASTTPASCERLEFAAGSMGPKVEAACRFVDAPAAAR